jgi:K+-transporting ATPase KdpF subunit
MSGLYGLAAAAALLIFVYLLVALFRPEAFE